MRWFTVAVSVKLELKMLTRVYAWKASWINNRNWYRAKRSLVCGKFIGNGSQALELASFRAILRKLWRGKAFLLHSLCRSLSAMEFLRYFVRWRKKLSFFDVCYLIWICEWDWKFRPSLNFLIFDPAWSLISDCSLMILFVHPIRDKKWLKKATVRDLELNFSKALQYDVTS